jgi:hypothetical protein
MNFLKAWFFAKLSSLLMWLSGKPKACEITGRIVLKTLSKVTANKSAKYKEGV